MTKALFADQTPSQTERRRAEYHMRHAVERDTWVDWAVAGIALGVACAVLAWLL